MNHYSTLNNKLNIDEIRYFMWNSIGGILNSCGNSYANTWCEQLLSIARKYGAYNGECIGDIIQLKEAFNNDYELSKKFMDYEVNINE